MEVKTITIKGFGKNPIAQADFTERILSLIQKTFLFSCLMLICVYVIPDILTQIFRLNRILNSSANSFKLWLKNVLHSSAPFFQTICKTTIPLAIGFTCIRCYLIHRTARDMWEEYIIEITTLNKNTVLFSFSPVLNGKEDQLDASHFVQYRRADVMNVSLFPTENGKIQLLEVQGIATLSDRKGSLPNMTVLSFFGLKKTMRLCIPQHEVPKIKEWFYTNFPITYAISH